MSWESVSETTSAGEGVGTNRKRVGTLEAHELAKPLQAGCIVNNVKGRSKCSAARCST